MYYLLNNGLQVEVGEDKTLPYVTIERMVMSFFDYKEDLETVSGYALWTDSSISDVAFISPRADTATAEGAAKFADKLGIHSLELRENLSIAQSLIKELDLVVEPVTFRNGSLAGLWRVARLSVYDAWNTDLHGVIIGVNQPVFTESRVMLDALYATACRVMGVGKEAYVYFPKGHTAEEFQVMACDFELAGQMQLLDQSKLVRVPYMDRYVTSRIPDDVLNTLVDEARTVAAARFSEAEALSQNEQESAQNEPKSDQNEPKSDQNELKSDQNVPASDQNKQETAQNEPKPDQPENPAQG